MKRNSALFLILIGLLIIHLANAITVEFQELRYSTQPLARSEYTAASDDRNDLIIFGGFKSDFELHHDLYVFDSSASKWIRYVDAPASYARRGASGVYYKGSLYIFGGTDIKFQYTNTIFRFNFENHQWTELTPTSGSSPTRYKHGAAVTSDGKMYVYGGNNGSGFIAGLSYYDIPTNRWVTVSQTGNIPTPRSMLSLSVFIENNDVKLILFGGLFNYNSGFNGYCPPDLFMFDIKTSKWSIRSPASELSPTKRTGQGVSVFGNKYFVFGGYSDRFLSDSHFFFSDTNTWSGNINTVGPFYPNGLTNGGMSCISKTSDTASCFVFGGVNGNHTQGYLDYLWHIGITF